MWQLTVYATVNEIDQSPEIEQRRLNTTAYV